MGAVNGGLTQSDLYLLQLAQTPDGQRKLRLAFPEQFGGGTGTVSSIANNPLITGASVGGALGASKDAMFNAQISAFDQKYGSLIGAGLQSSPEAAALYQQSQVGLLQQQFTGQNTLSPLGALGTLEGLGLGSRFGAGGVLGGGAAPVPGFGAAPVPGFGATPVPGFGGAVGAQQQNPLSTLLSGLMSLLQNLMGGAAPR